MMRFPKRIHQDVVKRVPHTAVVKSYGTQDIDGIATAIRFEGTTPFGLSVGIPHPSGSISSIAFATCHTVFALKLDAPLSQSQKSQLGYLLCDASRTLVAFEAAHLAILLDTLLGSPVILQDLSTTNKVPDGKLVRAGSLIASVDTLESEQRIDALWETRTENGEPDVCMRAWLTALYVQCS